MRKIAIFGNSGSGKTTLARTLSKDANLPHLDLDSVAWQPSSPSKRKAIDESRLEIDAFIDAHPDWVIEGCYSDLLELLLPKTTEVIFLNLPIELCVANAQNRPWEPHKYDTKEAQDANLNMLLEWIADYYRREDTFSQRSHQALFDGYSGTKTLYTNNPVSL